MSTQVPRRSWASGTRLYIMRPDCSSRIAPHADGWTGGAWGVAARCERQPTGKWSKGSAEKEREEKKPEARTEAMLSCTRPRVRLSVPFSSPAGPSASAILSEAVAAGCCCGGCKLRVKKRDCRRAALRHWYHGHAAVEGKGAVGLGDGKQSGGSQAR